eukprot:12237072-Karenia_brevis.AAC.1
MSAERAAWRQRLRDSYEEFHQRVRDFNRDMDVTMQRYISDIDSSTNNTRHEIIDLLENIQRVVNQHDDMLDRTRSTAVEDLQRHVGVFR